MRQIVTDFPTEPTITPFANCLTSCLTSPVVIGFSGEIGAGKTTFIRAMLRFLGESAAIKSPSFSLVESYQCSNLQIHHFDLYRINNAEELELIGFRDYFADNTICLVEWPERVEKYLEWVDILLHLDLKGEGREMRATAVSSIGNTILACLESKL